MFAVILVSFPGFCLSDKLKKCNEVYLLTNNGKLMMRMIGAEELYRYTLTKRRLLDYKF
jgi:hypothetical protein